MALAFPMAFAAPAFAASPEPPELHVEPVFATTATFRGVLNPQGSTEGGEYQFVYRQQTTTDEDRCKGTGEKKEPATLTAYPGLEREELALVEIKGLPPSTEYAACLVAKNGEGEATSTPVTFTTSAAGSPEAPEVAVESVKASEVTFHGMLNPAASEMVEAGTYQFVYRKLTVGDKTCRGTGETLAPLTPTIALGGPHEEVYEPITTGLTANTEYAVCLIAERDDGHMETSPSVSFTTALKPEEPKTKSPAADITAASAVLEGTLNPHATREVGGYFAYSEPGGTSCTEGPTAGLEGFEGEQDVPAMLVHTTLGGLEPHQTYKFCLVAANGAGETTAGDEVAFETLVSPPMVASEKISKVESKSAILEAQINANNEATTYAFEYSTRAAGETLEGTIAKVNGASALTGFGEQTANVAAAALSQGTTYYYRAIAENAANEKAVGKVEHFTTVPTANTDPASEVSASTVIFNGHLTLSPVYARYSFDYKAEASGSECQGEGTTTQGGGTGSETRAVTTQATGLIPSTRYAVCLVSTNESGSEVGPDVTFTTPPVGPPAAIAGSYFETKVTGSSAKLHAEIDPNGSETSYFVEYGPTTSYGQSTSVTALRASDDGAHPASAEVQSLTPGTAYHYRAVASNEAGGKPNTVYGPDATFTTQGEGEALALPDGRVWELVSPPARHGAPIVPPSGLAPVQAAADGGAIAYGMIGAIEAGPEGNRVLEPSEVISTHDPAGWSSRDIATENETVGTVGYHVGFGDEYRLFSPDLSTALVWPLSSPTPLPPLPPTAEQTLYLRHSDGSFEALVTAANVETGAHFGGTTEERPSLKFLDATPDFAHVVFHSEVPLTSNAVGAGLYEWSAGRLQLVSVLPSGEPDSEYDITPLGAGVANTRGAIASNGNVFWWAEPEGERHLYMFDTETGKSVELDTVQSGATGEGSASALYQDTSAEGTMAFFTDSKELTPGASEGSLYEYDTQTGKLSDLTIPVNPGENASVQGGLPGVSEDGSYVYVVVGGVLTTTTNAYGETATAGADNLYELRLQGESWEPTFIATLSGSDAPDWGGYHSEPELIRLTSQASPDGRYLAFMSQRSLTGYDNHDAISDAPDEEVYLYDAQSSKLVCASCDPSGARPTGIDDSEAPRPLVDEIKVWRLGTWFAASVPGWTPDATGEALYQSRYLDDSGRMFFDSPDALVPQAVNHSEDVYEYELPNTASESPPNDSCTTSSSTYSPAAQGCIDLISSGTSSQESEFLDASESGDDVFFLSAARLTPQAPASGYNVYDAHVCGVGWACDMPQPVSVAACESASECKAPTGPAGASVGSTPASASFEGTGNLAPAAASASPSNPKTLTRVQKLASALKACSRVRNRKRRTACLTSARRRYGKKSTHHGTSSSARRSSSKRGPRQ